MSVVPGRAGNLKARSVRRGTKFGNIRTEVDGVGFHSKREAGRYQQLQLLIRNGEVRDLLLQVPFRIEVNGKLICTYIADFAYVELRKGIWQEVVEDVKGYRTPMYRLKKKLMKIILGIDIRET